MKFILSNWVKYYTKEIAKALVIPAIGTGIALTLIIVKYKPAYEVTFAGENLGFIENKKDIEIDIKNYLEDTTGNVAFREVAELPEYEFKFINRDKQTGEESVMTAVANATKTTYRTYAVTVDGNVQVILGSEEDAKNIAQSFKTDMNEAIEMNVGIVEQFTDTLTIHSQEEADNIINTVKLAKVEEYNAKLKAEEEERARRMPIATKTSTSAGMIAGMVISKPVSGGSISSRFGSRSSIRSSAHTGLDIAISSGAAIHPIAKGTVKFADYKGSYGNLVIIDHGNGIESYYAHCSAIYCSVGEAVTTDTVISAVGSTGNSTGPHLHLEIRQNGNPLNPENYLY